MTFVCRHSPGCLLLIALLILGRCGLRAELTESIYNQSGVPTDLTDAQTAGDLISTDEVEEAIEGFRLPVRYLGDLHDTVPKTGSAFLDDLEFSLEPRFYYRMTSNADDTQSQAAAWGGALRMVTGWGLGMFQIGVTGYTSQALYAPVTRGGTGLLQEGQNSYSVLGESYALIRLGKSVITVGRKELDLPYINTNDSRMTPNTFEFVGLRILEIDNLEVGGAHLFRIKPRTASRFFSMSKAAGARGTQKGVTLGGARYEWAEGTSLAAINEYGWDTFNTAYVEGTYLWQINEQWSLKGAVQFTDQRSVGEALIGDFEAQLLGLSLALGWESLIASFSMTWAAAGTGVEKPWGASPSYNSIMISDFDRAGEKSYGVGLSYDFSDLGLTGFAISTVCVYGAMPDGRDEPDRYEWDLNFDYRPEIAGFKSVWLRLRYGMLDAIGRPDEESIHDFRVIMNYSIDF